MGSGLDETIYWTVTRRNYKYVITTLQKITGTITQKVKSSTLQLLVAPGTNSVI
jgi:hypothetical protein